MRFVTAASICLFGTSANALSMDECRAQYKAENGTEVQVKRCGIDPKASPPTPAAPRNIDSACARASKRPAEYLEPDWERTTLCLKLQDGFRSTRPNPPNVNC
jgi:hypothetical protein